MKKIVAILAAALFVAFAGVIYTQLNLYREYAAEANALKAELAKESAVYQRLEREKEQYMSDAYVEKIAREKLGLVRHDEIVFINDAAR